jgi:alpha-L-arabinofuranosidase
MQPYIQDAIDLVEFANGNTQTKWGKLRASMGHPAPFNLSMMGVGNENWGPQYIERLQLFTDAVRKKCPGIRFINSSGTDPSGDRFNFLDTSLRKMKADLIDEHYYRPPEWFLQNAGRYDHYERNGSKIFAGEYAAHGPGNGEKKSTWACALAEAAFMTGLERNADVVTMASYAPLLAHVDGWQWAPDLIWFDNLHSYGTPEYYVQQLFSNNKGNVVVPLLMNDSAVAGDDSLYASAVIDKKTNELIIKIVNASGMNKENKFILKGLTLAGNIAVISYISAAPAAGNSLNNPKDVSPVNKTVELDKDNIRLVAAPYSFEVIRLKMK